ncbi:hypothetical protein TNCV_4569501 [Trichonephila clavipes]|nr:hypothetical protein TNCV_4569501 [Trichonephila clavipes]
MEICVQEKSAKEKPPLIRPPLHWTANVTPGHFLVGRPITAIAEPSLTEVSDNRDQRKFLTCQRKFMELGEKTGDKPTQRDKPSNLGGKSRNKPTQRDKTSNLGV